MTDAKRWQQLMGVSLHRYSSHLSPFWFKIEQHWPFGEISIFNNGGHLGWTAELPYTFLKEAHPSLV
jgi:hypothetical protein